MSARSRRKWRGGGARNFCQFHYFVFQSPEYAKLKGREVKALVDLYMQYRGFNNGALSASWAVMHERGWRSKSQLQKALSQLEQRGWIVQTRQGGLRIPNLYAVTFYGDRSLRGGYGCRCHAERGAAASLAAPRAG